MKIYQNFDLTVYNSYRIKSLCKTAYFPENEQDVVDLYTNIKDFILIGSGNNIILSKDYYDESFVVFNGNFETCLLTADCTLEAEAGSSMLNLSIMALENELSGIEIFYDIPSSLGGAVVMNAGASGAEIKDVLIKVRYLDLIDLQIKEIYKENMDFQYRNSFFQRNSDKIVLKAWLKLQKGDKKDIAEKMELIKEQRWSKQPKEFPNAGSVFKRPKGFYVGAMMDELNLKGFIIGGAKISEKHGGFIVNFDNATGKDILAIILHVKQKVMEKFNIDLEVEQRVL